MKQCACCKVIKPMTDFGKDRAMASGIKYSCKECLARKRRDTYQIDPGKSQLSSNNWKKKNSERQREYLAGYRAENKEKRNSESKEWRLSNKVHVSEYNKKYTASNYSAALARSNLRHARKKTQAPIWRDEFVIAEIYDLCVLRNRHTNIKWHVDHIVPLTSKIVSGLHVEFNLRVIPALHNLQKRNLWWPDMPMREAA